MKRFLKAALCLIGIVAAVWIFCPKPDLYGDIPFSTAVYDQDGRLLRLELAADGRYRLYTPLEKLAPAAVQGTLLYEDAHFYRHPGVNPLRLMEAFWTTYVRRSRRIGASTISMQLARIRFGIDSGTLGGKFRQIVRAIQLERHYSKHDILEAYLNLAPYGGNVEGLGTASLVYYGKRPERLSLVEALSLCVVPQNPAARTPRPRGGPPELDAARQRLFAMWVAAHPEDARQAPLAALPLDARTPAQLPFAAPHFVQEVTSRLPVSNRGAVDTGLDLDLQRLVERHARAYVARRRADGIRNTAVLLVDWRDMQVKAMLGSADFADDSIQGQVDGTEAKRSPGSALKPFIYALGLQQGLIQPHSLLKDAPTRFGIYTPENFEHNFLGPVSATDALVGSRNVPAVNLMASLKSPGYYGLLQQAGITGLKDEKFYGLSLALGGAEVTMEEMLRLYAALPNGGQMRPLLFMPGSHDGTPPVRLLTPEASFITLQMLAENPRPDALEVKTENADPFPVYWKTGTSYSFRDAWSVGVFGPYVMAVWVGNFDASSNPAFVGREAAAPLFFDLVDALHARIGNFARFAASPHNLNVTRVEVCAVTGDLPNRWCPHTTTSWFIPGVSPIKVSDVYRRVAINPATGRRACRIDAGTRFAVYEFWSSELLKLFREAGIQRRTPPPFDQGCSLDAMADQGVAPRISSPQTMVSYPLPADQVNIAQVPFTAVSDAGTRILYWFVDEHFVGETPRDKPLFWTLQPGHFEVRVVDDQGRGDVRPMDVQLVPVER
jgi:penicillin-binding protein 1C